jgi:hypothetical protein
VDSLEAYTATYPADVEGWYLLGEALFHTHPFRPNSPEAIWSAFDSVLRRDSTLFPALIHPVELAILTHDSARFGRYYPTVESTAPAAIFRTLRTTAQLVWGPEPGDSALAAALREEASWIIMATNSSYKRERATSDSIVRRFARVQRVGSKSPIFRGRGYAARSQMLAGLGRWKETLVLTDSLRRLDPEKALEVRAWATALGLSPPSRTELLDTAVAAIPAGAEREYAAGLTHLVRGELEEGRRRINRALASPDSSSMPPEIRGYLLAADGWGALLQGDSANGLRRLRAGLQLAAVPGQAEESGFLRFQLALALAARPETREEGITHLRYGFDFQPLFIPLTDLALGRTYEAAGKPDSAAQRYRRFLRLWDKSDPELQGRVTQARLALEELTRERPTSP